MKRFLIKLFKVLVCFYILLWLMQFALDIGLRNNKADLYNEWNTIYEGNIDADMVFLGSSRTVKHYDPIIFDKAFNLKSYNLGANGTKYDLQMLKSSAYFDHNEPPKFIIQNVDVTSLRKTKNLFEKQQYLPYYTLDNHKYLKLGDNSITLEYVLPMYKYRSFFDLTGDVFNGYFGKDYFKRELTKGYNGQVKDWDNEFERQLQINKDKLFDFSDINMDERFSVFEDLLSKLKEKKAITFLIWAPEYYERIELEGKTLVDVKKRYVDIAKANKSVYFFDFTKDSLCYSKDYFYNSYHLNKKGAEIFCNKVVDSIKKHIKLEYQ